MRIHSFRVRKFEEVDFEVVDLFLFCRLAGTFFFWGPLIQTVNRGVFFDRVWVIDTVPTGCSGMFLGTIPGLPVIPCEEVFGPHNISFRSSGWWSKSQRCGMTLSFWVHECVYNILTYVHIYNIYYMYRESWKFIWATMLQVMIRN